MDSGIGGALPTEPWYMGGPVIKGFGRGSKVLGIPTGMSSSILSLMYFHVTVSHSSYIYLMQSPGPK